MPRPRGVIRGVRSVQPPSRNSPSRSPRCQTTHPIWRRRHHSAPGRGGRRLATDDRCDGSAWPRARRHRSRPRVRQRCHHVHGGHSSARLAARTPVTDPRAPAAARQAVSALSGRRMTTRRVAWSLGWGTLLSRNDWMTLAAGSNPPARRATPSHQSRSPSCWRNASTNANFWRNSPARRRQSLAISLITDLHLGPTLSCSPHLGFQGNALDNYCVNWRRKGLYGHFLNNKNALVARVSSTSSTKAITDARHAANARR